MEKIITKRKPKITVITPTYNRANLIVETIESILNQDFEDFEYFILDDGSSDNTEEVVKPYLKDKRVKYLKHENAGEAETVNWGWSLAKGEYFTQVNSDDPILPGLFSEMVRVLDEKLSVVVAYPDFYITDAKGEIIKKDNTPDWNFLDALSNYSCYAASAGTFIRKSAFSDWNKIKNSKFKHISDVEMYWKMALRGDFFHVSKFLATWRVHSSSISADRYQCIPEVEIWFDEYFSRSDLPRRVRDCMSRTKIAMYSYFIHLLEEGVIPTKEKNEKLKKYKKKLTIEREKKDSEDSISISKSDKINPLVSIVIPVYNGEKYMREAIDSALAQTYKNIEVIVVNDGSIDDTEKIAKSYGDKIRYFSKENGGVATALNLAIKKSKGVYISWLSHDDIYYHNKIERQINYLKKERLSTESIVFSKCEVFDELENKKFFEEIPNFNFKKKKSILKLLFLSGLNGCTLLIPRAVFKTVGYFNEELKTTQDYDLWFRLIYGGYDFRFCNETLIVSRRHENQGTKKLTAFCESEKGNLFQSAFEMFRGEFMQLTLVEFGEITSAMKASGLQKIGYLMDDARVQYYAFKNLQVGDNDLIGNKFNGHDLHRYLREKQIDSFHLVWNKESFDENTFSIAGEKNNREDIKQSVMDIQKTYELDGVINPIMFDIIYNKLFLESDIIHLHLMHNGLIDVQLLPLLGRLKPLVWTLHDPWPLSGHCIQHFRCNKWKSGCQDCPNLDLPFEITKDNSALNYILKKQSIQNANIEIIVASKLMFDKVKESPTFKGKSVHLIPFGIDHTVFTPWNKSTIRKKLNIPDDVFVISFRGDNNYKKGLDYIEYVIKNIKTTKEIYFLVFGGGVIYKESRFKYIEYGWIKDDLLMVDIYNASDLFLMPSTVESFGMMAIEAMSCGTLPIVLDGTALPDTVNAPECGVSTKRNKDEFLKAVQYYINHDREREERAKKCLKFARDTYNKDIYIERILEVYKGALEKHELSEEYEQLLKQLKKYMMIEPVDGKEEHLMIAPVNNKEEHLFDGKVVTESLNIEDQKYVHLSICRKLMEFVPKKTRTAVRTKLLNLILLGARFKNEIRKILRWFVFKVSPTFRMLSGNRHRMNVLLEKVENLEKMNEQKTNVLLEKVENLEKMNEQKTNVLLEKVENLEKMNEQKTNVLLEKVENIEKSSDENSIELEKIGSFIKSDSYKQWQRAEILLKNKSELNISNDGERLVPGYSNNKEEIIRHRSTYLLFKKIIENDIINNPEIIKKGIRILDLGSGVGHGTKILSEIINSSVVGIEIDEDAVNFAKNNYSSNNLEYINDSIEDYLKNEESFDYVVSRHALEHIDMSLNEVGGKLKFKYRAMLSVPYKEGEGNEYHKHLMISEDNFSNYQNKEFFYEDLQGFNDLKPFTNKITNSFTCVINNDIKKPSSHGIKFPMKPAKIDGLEKDFFNLFNLK